MVNIIFKDNKIRGHLDQQECHNHIWRERFYDDQPVLNNPNTGNSIGFCREVSKWFLEFNIKYKLFWVSNTATGITFEKESDAILFKLTWL